MLAHILDTEETVSEADLGRTKRVLVVEDDPDDFFIVKDVLSRDLNHIYKLQHAVSLAAAQEALLQASLDVVLLD